VKGAIAPKVVAAVMFALLLPISVSTHAGQALSLPGAIATAFAQNPELAAARWEIGVAEGDRVQAGLIPNPELSWEVEDTRRNTSTTTVLLSQTLELGGKRGARIDLATRGQSAAQIELERRANDLRADVMQAFYAAARAQTGVQLAQASQQLAERGLAVAQGRIRAGKSSPVEATRAEVQLAETRLQVKRAETVRASSYRELATAMGAATPAFERLEVEPLTTDALPPAPPLLAVLNQSAPMRLAEAQIARQEAALGSERAQRIPDLTVSVGSQYAREDRERVNVVGVSMPLPLFNRNQGNVLSASRRADQARDLRNAVELRLRSQVESALDLWVTASREVEAFNQVILPSAQNAVDTATRGFEMGKFGFLEVLDAQRTLIEARGQYLQSLAMATDAQVSVARIYGDLGALHRPL
jgi:cobalt-zinc-cadmium efflux system outer membrane protein